MSARWSLYRWTTALLVLGYGLLLALTLALWLWREPRSEFKVSSVTEAFGLVVSRTLRIGPTPVRLPAAPGRRDCVRATLELPPGTQLKGKPGVLEVLAPAGAGLGVRCEGSTDATTVAALEILLPRERSGNGDKAEPRLVMRVAGTLNLGGELDEASPAADIPLLRSAKIIVETKELFGNAVASTSERQVEAGYRLSFRRDPQGPQEPEVEGVLIVRPQVYELVVRYAGHSAVMTPPGAGRGTGSIVAPSFLDQVKGQANWGAGAIALALALGLLEVFRSYASAPKDVR